MKNELVVVQSNRLIEAHYKQQYTAQEQKMVLWIVSEIHKEWWFTKKYEHKTITISAQKYAELMEIDVNNVYRRAEEVGKNLMQKVFKIRSGNGWEMFSWLYHMKYENGLIEVSIAPAILPHIIAIGETFTKFGLENILCLNSSHAIKVYQILAQYKAAKEKTITLDEFKSTLGIGGHKAYDRYDNVKTKILEISKREINKKTDLIISYSEIKTGKKVTTLKFKITQKPNQEAQAKKEFERYILQLPDGDTIKTLFQTHGFDQTLVKNKFQEFLAEKAVNYDPESSKPIILKNFNQEALSPILRAGKFNLNIEEKKND
jgi:plasmid replication initiation protein